ncbi:MAG: HD domain-containing protein [Clostridia bacterium]|jgi:dGTPase
MKKFYGYSATEDNPKWEQMISRENEISRRENDIRSDFYRDYTRIINSRAYRRLKSKTQVFFATRNDHVCTRAEHVNNVSSIGFTIAKHLGLNEELVMAIAAGHDLGHAPFGHSGERILDELTRKHLNERFRHEQNSLRFVDKCETIQNAEGKEENLNLTYAVRDGIVTHCGEIENKQLKPRNEIIDLSSINDPTLTAPFTYEGCVVKASDIIAYIGRDIEDALRLKVIYMKDVKRLDMNNTTIIYNLTTDLCLNSDPEHGICFSDEGFELLKKIKDFNYKYIYGTSRLRIYEKKAKLIIESLFSMLMSFYKGNGSAENMKSKYALIYPELVNSFSERLNKYSFISDRPSNLINIPLYDLDKKEDYIQAVIDFISSMTDSYANKLFDEITSF